MTEVRALKFRRRGSLGVSRLWVGDKRRRVLNILLGSSPSPAAELSDRSGLSLSGTLSLLFTLEAAGLAQHEAGIWQLTSLGREQVDDFVLRFRTSCW